MHIHCEALLPCSSACLPGERIAACIIVYIGAECKPMQRRLCLLSALSDACVLCLMSAAASLCLEYCRLFESGTAGGIVKALRIPNGKAISNARIKTKGDVASRSPVAHDAKA